MIEDLHGAAWLAHVLAILIVLLAAGWVFLRTVGQSRDWMPNFFFAAPILIGLYYLLKTVFTFLGGFLRAG